MVRSTSFLIFLLSLLQAFSQEQKLKIDYDLYINGLSLSKWNAEMFVTDEYSVFVWNNTTSKYEENESEENELELTLEFSDSIGTINYYSKKRDSIFTRTIGFEEVKILQEKRIHISWKLHSETKTIGEFECNKASCTFRGRDYEVWYTPEIPVFYGPWKLHGLPGLVMEVKDKEGMLQAYFKKFSQTNRNLDRYLNALQSDSYISIEEYAEAQRDLGDELLKKMKLSFPREYNISIDGIKQDRLEREFN